MDFVYPLDTTELLRHARARGDEFLRTVGLDQSLRDDLVLQRIATRATAGWFPFQRDHRWHGALDIGFRDHGDDTLVGLPVRAVAAGTVVYEDAGVHDAQGRCQGRVITRHEHAGNVFYCQYKHLRAIRVSEQAAVKAGDVLGELGPHEGFPHLELAIASRERLGGDGLTPEIHHEPVTPLNPAWDALRVEVPELDPMEWPVRALGFEAGFVYSPIEFLRHCRGEPALHDAGPASTHAVNVLPRTLSVAIGPATDQCVEVSYTFRHPKLRVKAIEALGREFQPVFERNDARAEAVTALQLALRDAGFPNLPATGKYGPKTEDAIRTFQRDKLKAMVRDGAAAFPGRSEGDVRVDGKVDWLTLVGLDAYAAAHAAAPTPKAAAKAAEKAPPRPIPPAEPRNTLDATQGSAGLSIHVGVRMIKAMLAWYWNGDWDGSKLVPREPGKPLGVGYSTTVEAHYGDDAQIEDGTAVIPRKYNPEWPDIGLDQAWQATGGQTVPGSGERIYHAWGRAWKATGFSNCCNTVMAALSVALGGTSFGVKGGSEFGEERGDEARSYDITNREAPLLRREFKGKQQHRSAMSIFGDLFANTDTAATYRAPDGTKLLDGRHGTHICAIARFGMGEAIMPFTQRTNQQQFQRMRIGDLAASSSHAFVIGDVRYAVWVRQEPPPPPPVIAAGAKKKKAVVATVDPGPHFILDQSSFIDAEEGVLVGLQGKSRTDYGLRQIEGQPVLDARRCDRLLTAEGEAEFMRRVEAFVSKKTGDALGPHVLEKIELIAWRIFSANGRTTCAHALPYSTTKKGFVAMTDDEVKESPDRFASVGIYVQHMGVTAPWGDSHRQPISLGRFFAPVSRT